MNRHEKIDTFKILLKAGNYCDRTIENYYYTVRTFLSSFKGDYKKATNEQLAEYIAGQKSSTRMRQTYSALKLFYKLVLRRKQLFGFIPFPRSEQRLRHLPERGKLLEAINSEPNIKHRTILMMLYGTGIRLSELLDLKWSDIKREQGINPLSLFIRGKGKKDRIVPLSQNLFDILLAYCREYGLDSTCKDCYIFGNEKKYSARSVANIVERAGDRMDFHLTPHLLRHACFQHLADNGIELPYIGEIAGHKSPETTMIYARLRHQKVEMPV